MEPHKLENSAIYSTTLQQVITPEVYNKIFDAVDKPVDIAVEGQVWVPLEDLVDDTR